MLYVKDYSGCKVIIYDDKTEAAVAKTTIVEFDRISLTIHVPATALRHKISGGVSLLVFYENLVYEFKGNIRKTNKHELVGIALYDGKPKEGRGSKRYDVRVPARVENLIVSNQAVKLQYPLAAAAMNISKAGVLIRARQGAFGVGTAFQLILDIDSAETVLNTFVVRVANVDANNSEYGCIFFSPEESDSI